MERILRPCISGIFVTIVLYGIGCDGGGITPDSSPSSTSSGATGAGGMMSSTGSGQGGSAAECTVPDDCPDPGSICFVRTCIDQTCGKTVQNGFEVSPMAVGDCKHSICDPNGNIVVAADSSDIYDDGNDCTTDTCNGQTPENDPRPKGYLCTDGLCSDTPAGTCVDCLVNAHCAGDPANPLCRQGQCVASSCGNGTQDPGEPATDCGKDCTLCPDGSPCISALDCISGSCLGTPKTCQPATCMDALTNGKETDEDCGGPDCPKCAPNFKCIFPSDCDSGVCLPSACDAGVCGNKCVAPSCTDGVMNQTETAVDCGGGCTPCP